MFVSWKRNVMFETAVLFAERWRHLAYSNEPNFINNALLVAKEYFHFKLSNVTKRTNFYIDTSSPRAVRFAHCSALQRTAVLACAQCVSRTEAPSNGLRKYHRRERHDDGPTWSRGLLKIINRKMVFSFFLLNLSKFKYSFEFVNV